MKVIRWPDLDIVESSLKVVDEFWYQSEKGPIFAGTTFPLSELDKLKSIKQRIEAKKKELSDIEAEIYRVSRKF